MCMKVTEEEQEAYELNESCTSAGDHGGGGPDLPLKGPRARH